MFHGITLILKGIAACGLAAYLLTLGDVVGFEWQYAIPVVGMGLVLAALGVCCIRTQIREEVRAEVAEYEAQYRRPLGEPGH